MATSLDFIKYVCEQIEGIGEIRYQKMFGEFLVYVNEKPVITVCDDIPYVKKLDVIKEMMESAETGFPYKGAKEHYILDMDNSDFCKSVVAKIEKVISIPQKRKNKMKKRRIKMVHLVYCDDKSKELEKIMSGSKTMVIRGAAGRKIPHSRVFKDEVLYFMEKGSKKITAKAVVTDVQNLVKLIDEEITKNIEENNDKLQLTDKQKERWHKKCLCLIEFKDVESIDPLDFDHQGNMDDWLIIEKIEDVVVGTSIPYNYEKSRF